MDQIGYQVSHCSSYCDADQRVLLNWTAYIAIHVSRQPVPAFSQITPAFVVNLPSGIYGLIYHTLRLVLSSSAGFLMAWVTPPCVPVLTGVLVGSMVASE